VVPVIEGSRPLLVEIQALTTFNSYGQVRRTANGIDFNRLLLVAAVLSRRVGLKLSNQDIIVNVTGGLKVGEPAADLGIALAIASSYRDVEVLPHTAAIGEVGLSGELRPAAQMDRRLAEVARLGFTKCIVPKMNAKLKPPEGLELIIAGTLREAVYKGLVAGKKKVEEDEGEAGEDQ
jgi:DNA repair protein RadA/Sms